MATQDRFEDRVNGISRRSFCRGLASVGIGFVAQSAATAIDTLIKGPRSAAATAGARPRHAVVIREPKEGPSLTVDPAIEARVQLNQVGYLPGEHKRAVVPAQVPLTEHTFDIIDDDEGRRVRYRGSLIKYQAQSGEEPDSPPFIAHFDTLRRPGRYRLRLADDALSPPFTIGKDVYAPIAAMTLGFFDLQQCGPQTSSLRHHCHLDDGVIVGGSRDGERIETSGGWHDAGDYLKFVETTSYVTALMLFAYDRFPELRLADKSSAGLPPLLSRAKVGLDWLLKMHPTPEEFYYQVGDASDHDTWRLPEKDCPDCNPNWKARKVYAGVGANLAGRTATAFAMGARLYRRYDSAFAARCLAAAESAYALGRRHPEVLTTTPTDFYPETTWQDDMEWAAAALYRTTRRPEYLQQALAFAVGAGPAHEQTSVYNTHTLAHYTLYPFAPPFNQGRLLDYMRIDADAMRKQAENPYGLGTPYMWGTAEGAAGAALTCLLYAELSHEPQYRQTARKQRDFILGCNPFGTSFVVGAGTHYPKYPHHQIADLDKIRISGAMVGGPTSAAVFLDEHIQLSASTLRPAVVAESPDTGPLYHDDVNDYVSNEPAIDYTAKFLLLSLYSLTA